jgi:tetratricopeptide (TPR) repeat protein
MSTVSLQPPAWLPRAARPYSRFSHLWQVPIFLAGIAALVVAGANALALYDAQQQQIEAELAHVRQLLQKPGLNLSLLLPQVERLVDQCRQHPGKAGEAHFLLAKVLLRQADQFPEEKTRELCKKAMPHLEQAEALGVLPAERPQLWYLIGKAMYHTSGDLHQAISYLSRALPRGADDPAEGYGLLVQAYLHLTPPDVRSALKANEMQLRLCGKEEVLLQARLLRGELLIQKRQYDEALRILEQIGPKAPIQVQHRAAVLLATTYEAEGQWGKAARIWQGLLQSPAEVPGGKRRILFAIGNCCRNATPPDDAGAIQAWTLVRKEGGAEAQAAGLRLAELHLLSTQKDFDLALEEIIEAFGDIKEAKDFKNKLISQDEVRELVRLGVASARAAQAFAQAQHLAELYKALVPTEAAVLLYADVTQLWADTLEQQAPSAGAGAADGLRKLAREQWVLAANAYTQAAAGRNDASKADFVWKAMQCYRSAQQVAGVRESLEKYLALPTPAERRAEGWFLLAETHLALNEKTQARQACYKCLEYPTSPCAYKARYQIAEEEIEAKHYELAEKILKENLQVAGMEVDRQAREQSQYRLALLLYQRKDYTQAIIHLKEAARQFPANPRVFEVRYALGDSCLVLARQDTLKLDPRNALPPDAQAHLRTDRLKWLEVAADVFQKLADDLEWSKSKKPLSPGDELLLRKASFVAADAHLEMNNVAEALRRYSLLAQKYRGMVEELFACQRLWTCCRALAEQPNQRVAAVEALASALPSAKSTLWRLPAQEFQGSPSTWSRTTWETFFREVERQLPQLSTQTPRPQSPPVPLPAPPGVK